MEKFNVQSIIASNKYLIPENADMNIITKIVKKNPITYLSFMTHQERCQSYIKKLL